MSQGLEILKQEILNELKPTIMVEIKPMVKKVINEVSMDPNRVLNVSSAMKIFGLSRIVVDSILVSGRVPVRFENKGGLGDTKLFLYKDFSRAVEAYIKKERKFKTAEEIDDEVM